MCVVDLPPPLPPPVRRIEAETTGDLAPVLFVVRNLREFPLAEAPALFEGGVYNAESQLTADMGEQMCRAGFMNLEREPHTLSVQTRKPRVQRGKLVQKLPLARG